MPQKNTSASAVVLGLFCLIPVFFGCSPTLKKAPPSAVNGVIDLASWDFARDGILDLKGEWKFRWMNNDPDCKRPDCDDAGWDILSVPNFWNAKTGGPHGYCWLRLKIKNLAGADLGVFLKSAHRSYALYADGEKLMANGTPGGDGASTVHQRLPLMNSLPKKNDVVLAWQIANFVDNLGGPAYAIKIGEIQDLSDAVWGERSLQLFIIGFILMMSVYHIFLWFGRREDVISLLFASFCLMIAARIIIMNNYPVLLFPQSDIFELLAKMEVIVNVAAWFFLQNFFNKLFPAESPRGVFRAFYVCALLFIVTVLFTPAVFHSKFLFPAEALLLAPCFITLFSILKAARNGRQGAWIVLIGFLVIVLTLVNDIVFSNVAGVTVPLIHVGLVVFSLFQSTVLSLRYASAFRTAAHLSENLRREVDAQTKTISEKNEELVRLNEERTDFFINLAHETKTPLTLIYNYAKKYMREKGRDADFLVILRNIEKLKNDMVNYLDYEKLKRGQVFYDHGQTVNLSALLENRIVLFKETASKKSIRLTSAVREAVGVRMDPDAVERVINNLLDNAVRYTENGGEIRVSLTMQNENALFVVEDDGPGISEEQQKSIFKPYHQLSHKKRNIQGIGMGLSIVKRIIDDVGGKIEIRSRLGQGAAFAVTLRARALADEEAAEETGDLSLVSGERTDEKTGAAPAAEAAGAARRAILIVEDNEEMSTFLSHSLKDSFAVFRAANGREALERLRSLPLPHLIISDIMMDEMDGYAFREELLKNEPYRSLPFIFLTAKTGSDEKLKGLSKGAVDFVSKPFDVEELLAKIKNLLALAEAQREAGEKEAEKRVIQAIRNKSGAEEEKRQVEKQCRSFGLTEREQEILELILAGKEDKEIGAGLNVSYHTVRSHIKNIYKKCRIQNKIELFNIFKK